MSPPSFRNQSLYNKWHINPEAVVLHFMTTLLHCFCYIVQCLKDYNLVSIRFFFPPLVFVLLYIHPSLSYSFMLH